MIEKVLKKMSRAELLELLIEQEKENIYLKDQLDTYKKKLVERKIEIDNVGSLAEATFAINGVYAAVDRAVHQYLDNIKDLRDSIQTEHDEIIEQARAEAEKIMSEAEAHALAVVREANKLANE